MAAQIAKRLVKSVYVTEFPKSVYVTEFPFHVWFFVLSLHCIFLTGKKAPPAARRNVLLDLRLVNKDESSLVDPKFQVDPKFSSFGYH